MKIKDIQFVKSVFIDDSKVLLEEKKEVIFIWRSNVGKSSIMNALFNKKDLVKTSSKPWKTITANLFLMNSKYLFTDLPGYGFAKLWKEVLDKLDWLISWYLEERRTHIKKVVLLIDTKIGLQQKDLDMFAFVQGLKLPVLIVLSKIDRLSKTEVMKSKMHTEKELFWQQVMAVSSHKRVWIKELFNELADSLQEK